MQCRILLAWLMGNCKRRRDLKNCTQIKDRGGNGGGSDVVDGFLKQPVTREAKGQIRNVPGCFACCVSWLQDQRDDARKRCNRRPRANAVWFTRNSSRSSFRLSCLKQGVGRVGVQIRGWLCPARPRSIVVETGAARTLLSIENVPTICNDD